MKLLPLSDVDKTCTHPTAGKLFARIEITPCSQQPGPIAGEVYVSLAREKHRTPPIPVLGEVVNSTNCRTAMLVLPRRVQNQSLCSGDVLIFHRHEKPIDIALDSLPPNITAEVQTIEGRSDQRRLHIEWRPDASSKNLQPRETRLRLLVRTDGKEMKMEVPVFLAEN